MRLLWRHGHYASFERMFLRPMVVNERSSGATRIWVGTLCTTKDGSMWYLEMGREYWRIAIVVMRDSLVEVV